MHLYNQDNWKDSNEIVRLYYGFWMRRAHDSLYVLSINHADLHGENLLLGEVTVSFASRFAESVTATEVSPATMLFLWNVFNATK